MWTHLIPAHMGFWRRLFLQLRKGLDWADLWTLLCLNQLPLCFLGGLKSLAYRSYGCFVPLGRVVDSPHFSVGEAGDQRDV